METSETHFKPEWLRSTGGGSGGGGLSHHFPSSQADGPLLAQPNKNRSSKSISNSIANHSSFLGRSSSTNSRRSSGTNGSSKHDKNPYSRTYGSSNRNQPNKDRDRLGIADTWDSEYSVSLTSFMDGRTEKETLRRSQSMVSRRPSESSQPRINTDSRNNSHNSNGNRNGAISVANGPTGIKKVTFERDFPLLGSDERPRTPDVIRVPSPRLSKGVQGLSIGTSLSTVSEGWTSALAEVPVGVGSNSISSSPASQPPHNPAAPTTAATTAAIASVSGASNGPKIAESSVQAPPRSPNASPQSVPTQRSEELAFMGSKRLIPMTPSMPKTLVLNPSDKLKPKTAMRLNEVISGPKNGLQQMSSLQLGSQSARNGGGRADGPKSSTTGKMQLLKPSRENGFSPRQTINVPSPTTNGQSAAAPSGASVPSKNPSNAKLQSRNDFFNLVRKKSMGSTSPAADSCAVVSSVVQNTDDQNEMTSGSVNSTENGSDLKCNGDMSNLGESCSDGGETDVNDHAFNIPTEEEEIFLRSLGWENNDGDEGGLTEEEINDFVQMVKKMPQSDHMERKLASKLCRGLQLILPQSDTQGSCSTGASSN